MGDEYEIGDSRMGLCSLCEKEKKVVLRSVKVKEPLEGYTTRWLCRGCEEDTKVLDEAEILK